MTVSTPDYGTAVVGFAVGVWCANRTPALSSSPGKERKRDHNPRLVTHPPHLASHHPHLHRTLAAPMTRSILGWLTDLATALICLTADITRRREQRQYEQRCWLDAMRDAGRGC